MYIFYLFNNNNTFSNLLIKVGIKLNTICPSETKWREGLDFVHEESVRLLSFANCCDLIWGTDYCSFPCAGAHIIREELSVQRGWEVIVIKDYKGELIKKKVPIINSANSIKISQFDFMVMLIFVISHVLQPTCRHSVSPRFRGAGAFSSIKAFI